MSNRNDRQRRLKLFDRGNTKCPICLTTFSRRQVAWGKDVSLEHAPPKTLDGRIVCLTCTNCNNRASRIDRLAKLAEKARDDHISGRGTRVEVDFFGAGIISGYVRPANEEMAVRFAKQPVPTSINQLRGGTMQLPSLPIGEKLDVNKGLRFRIRRPNPHKVAVSWLRSAYLLVFSLLGSEGYRYIESAAVQPVRDQIMNPDEVRIRGCLNGSISGVDFPVDPVVMLNYTKDPSFWAVKMGDRCVFLPCGGPRERFDKLTGGLTDLSIDGKHAAFWSSSQFRNECVLSFGLNVETDATDFDFVGGRLEVETQQGDVWEWIIVDFQSDEVIALPFRSKDAAQEENAMGVMMMLGEDEYWGTKDREGFVAASPRALLSLTVNKSNSKHN